MPRVTQPANSRAEALVPRYQEVESVSLCGHVHGWTEVPQLGSHPDISCDLGHMTASSGPHSHMPAHRCAPWVCGDQGLWPRSKSARAGVIEGCELPVPPCQASEHVTRSQALDIRSLAMKELRISSAHVGRAGRREENRMATGACTWQGPQARCGRGRAAKAGHLMGHSADARWLGGGEGGGD